MLFLFLSLHRDGEIREEEEGEETLIIKGMYDFRFS